MRILFLTSHLGIGGIPVYTVTLAAALARRGHQPIVASSGGPLVATLAAAGIPHVAVPLQAHSPLHPAALAALWRVVRLIRRHRPDVIHAQTRVAHVVAGVAGRLTGVPVVTTAHGFYRWHWWRRAFPCWGRRVIAVSRSVQRFLRERYGAPAGAIRVVLNGIAWNPPPPPALDAAAQAFRRHWGVSDRGPVIGTVARLVSAKEFPVLLEAFHQLRGTVPSAQLVIVGDGPDKPAIIRRAYALGEQDHVVITGAVSMTAIPLAVMDLFVLSSSNEAFGLAVVEAMAMGRPVVASRVGGIPDVVDDGVTGVLVPPRDPGALARALQRLVDDPEAARAMGRAGRARYERQFTMERVAREVEQVYEEVARG